MVEQIPEISSDIYEQLCDKGNSFSAYSVVLDESTVHNDMAPLAIYVCSIHEKLLVGTMTDGTPSMIGRKNRLVALAQKNWRRKGKILQLPDRLAGA